MTKERIEQIEKEFPADGFTGHIFFKLCCGKFDNLTETSVLPEGGVGLIMKGTGAIEERREQFLKIYDGCKNIADYIKQNVNA